MIAINLNVPLKNLDNQPIKDADGKELIMGKALSDVLMASSSGPAVKYYDWAMQLWNGKEINVDETDAKLIRQLIDTSDRITNLGKAQMLKIIDVAIASR